jgi:hypothetical protein
MMQKCCEQQWNFRGVIPVFENGEKYAFFKENRYKYLFFNQMPALLFALG